MWTFYIQERSLSRGTFTNNLNESKLKVLKNDLSLTSILTDLVVCIANTVLFDSQKARDKAARRLHVHESYTVCGLDRLPLSETWSSWFGEVAFRHVSAGPAHALSHSYAIVDVSLH